MHNAHNLAIGESSCVDAREAQFDKLNVSTALSQIKHYQLEWYSYLKVNSKSNRNRNNFYLHFRNQ